MKELSRVQGDSRALFRWPKAAYCKGPTSDDKGASV